MTFIVLVNLPDLLKYNINNPSAFTEGSFVLAD